MVIRTLQTMLLAISCLGILVHPLEGAERQVLQRGPRQVVLDVALGSGGLLVGEVRDRQGRAKPGADLVLWSGNRPLQRVRSDRQGQFRFRALDGGAYRIATDRSSVSCRAWTAGLAPPSARPQVLLVTGEDSARGQQPLQEAFVANPFVMGTIIAAAIAIPIAVHNAGDEDLPDGS